MVSAPRLYFEDFPAGAVFRYGSYRVTAAEIIAFAEEFDPQPFHLDENTAKASMLGELCASGWHVCAILMRMMFDAYLHQVASMGSTGIDEVKWIKPVYAGETLSCCRTTLEGRVSSKRAEMGILKFRWELFNTQGDLKTEVVGINLVRVRSAA